APEIKAAVSRLRLEREDLRELDEAAIHERLAEELLRRETWVIERVRKDKRQKIDVRRYTLELGLRPDPASLRIVTEISPNGGVKPTEVVAAVYGLEGDEMISLSSRVRRLRLYKAVEASDASLQEEHRRADCSGETTGLAARSLAGD
ncbi:MAG TPA: hypothetical protein VLD57_02680, partial [Blastocatellia bacterium]|nr:hypothetical protein [Blastocatellia bacterium]